MYYINGETAVQMAYVVLVIGMIAYILLVTGMTVLYVRRWRKDSKKQKYLKEASDRDIAWFQNEAESPKTYIKIVLLDGTIRKTDVFPYSVNARVSHLDPSHNVRRSSLANAYAAAARLYDSGEELVDSDGNMYHKSQIKSLKFITVEPKGK